MHLTTPELQLHRPGWLGVIGGMGPLATADFLAKLALATPAAADQEHIPVLLYGDCDTPDRTEAALGRGPSPLPKLLQAVDFLAAQGVQLIALPCNSAHAWHAELAAHTDRPVLHIVDACVQRLRQSRPDAQRVGVLSTEGSARLRIYAQRLERQGYQPLIPTESEFARRVSPGIAHVKANELHEARVLLEAAADELLARGAEVVILGCTEIPIAMADRLKAQPDVYIDCTEALVEAVITRMRSLSIATASRQSVG